MAQRYAVKFRRSAEKELANLSPTMQIRVLEAIEKLEVDPRPIGYRKLAATKPIFRIRVGDYRILYSINDVGHLVAIEAIRHRSQAYRQPRTAAAIG